MQTKRLTYSRFLTDLFRVGSWIYSVQDCIRNVSTPMSSLRQPVGMDSSTHGMLRLCTTKILDRSMAITSMPYRARPGGPVMTTSGRKICIWTAKNSRYQSTVWKACLAMSCRLRISVSQSLVARSCMCHQTHRTLYLIGCYHCQSLHREICQHTDMQDWYILL